MDKQLELGLEIPQQKEKQKILCVVGKSLSGKTESANYIEQKYSISMIQSYTDRPLRYKGEVGHTFITNEEMKAIPLKKKLAFTTFGGNNYCCTTDNVVDNNTYVLDERGLDYLTEHFSHLYNIRSVFIDTNKSIRYNRGMEAFRDPIEVQKRLDRDEGMYNHIDSGELGYYNHFINNDGTKETLFKRLDRIVEDFFNI